MRASLIDLGIENGATLAGRHVFIAKQCNCAEVRYERVGACDVFVKRRVI